MFTSLIFSHISVHSRESSWSSWHTQSWAPSPQKSAHSLYSPNTLLKAIFAAAFQEQRYCSCHFQLYRQNQEDILGIFFFFFACLVFFPSSPWSSPRLDSPQAIFVWASASFMRVSKKPFVITLFKRAVIGSGYTHYALANLHQRKCYCDKI